MQCCIIWTCTPHSVHFRAFIAALRFGKEISYSVAERHCDGHLWVVDARCKHWEHLQRLYAKANPKPRVVILGVPDIALDMEHSVLTTPIKAHSVLKTFEDISSGKSQQLSRLSWQEKEFRLKAWPNIAKYGTENRVGITITCSKLLRRYHNYQTVQKWGLTPPLLDYFLDDTYNTSLLEVKACSSDEYEDKPRYNEHTEDENVGLLQRFLRRFGHL